MKFTIETNDPSEIARLMAAINGSAPAQAAGTPARTAPPAQQALAQATPQNGGPTIQDVTKAVQGYTKVHKAAAAKAVLQNFGVNAIKDLTPDTYPAVIEAFRVDDEIPFR